MPTFIYLLYKCFVLMYYIYNSSKTQSPSYFMNLRRQPMERFTTYSDNQKKLLQLIYEKEQTRNELSINASLSTLTVSKFVSGFLADGIILETGTLESSGGRKASVLSINPHYAYVLAVDIGCSNVKIGVISIHGEMIEKREFHYYNGYVPTHVMAYTELIEELQTFYTKYGPEKILGISIGISGLIDFKQGRVTFCPNITGYNNLPLVDEIKKHFDVPVYLDTSARCMAVAEQKYGVGKGVANQIFISIGFSIGAGIIIDSKLFRGNKGYSGEIGHIAVPNEKHEQCTCGNYDCLETLVTFPNINNRIIEKLKQPNIYSIAKMLVSDVNAINPDIIKEALSKDDKVIYQVITQIGEEIGSVITGLTNILNPEMIILGGGVIECFPILVDEVYRTVRQKTLSSNQSDLCVKKSALGLDSALMGSAVQIINDFLG